MSCISACHRKRCSNSRCPCINALHILRGGVPATCIPMPHSVWCWCRFASIRFVVSCSDGDSVAETLRFAQKNHTHNITQAESGVTQSNQQTFVPTTLYRYTHAQYTLRSLALSVWLWCLGLGCVVVCAIIVLPAANWRWSSFLLGRASASAPRCLLGATK